MPRAFWMAGKGRCELREEAEPAREPGTVVVESLFGAISRGTESLVFGGHVPPPEFERMRCPHQEGGFGFPLKYGYAVVGRVASGPPGLEGREVFILHPHQDRFVVPAEDVVPLPEGVPAARAVLAANMETALNVVWDSGAAPADRIAIVGGGLLGLLVGYFAARLPGARATLVDLDLERRQVAEALGLAFAAPGEAPEECDIVIHASASEAGLVTALRLAGQEGRIVEMSWYGDRSVSVPLGGAFHARRLSIVSSQVGEVPPGRRARWSRRRRLEAALQLLADPALDVLVSGETRFEELPADYAAILADSKTLCHRIRYA